jgi:hypothetical protein
MFLRFGVELNPREIPRSAWKTAVLRITPRSAQLSSGFSLALPNMGKFL